MANTALRAEKNDSCTITFKNKEHEKFYMEHLPKCRYQDVYHKTLVYCLGIDRDTRENANRIYDFKTDYVKTGCLQEGWQTSGSEKIVRMAVEDLFCCGYARYFWEAIKIRYPEYCSYVDWEDMYAEN